MYFSLVESSAGLLISSKRRGSARIAHLITIVALNQNEKLTVNIDKWWQQCIRNHCRSHFTWIKLQCGWFYRKQNNYVPFSSVLLTLSNILSKYRQTSQNIKITHYTSKTARNSNAVTEVWTWNLVSSCFSDQFHKSALLEDQQYWFGVSINCILSSVITLSDKRQFACIIQEIMQWIIEKGNKSFTLKQLTLLKNSCIRTWIACSQ